MLSRNVDFSSSLVFLKSENDILKSNAFMPYNSCIALSDNLDKARDEIAFMKSNASLSCVLCESLLAEINELKLTHTPHVNNNLSMLGLKFVK